MCHCERRNCRFSRHSSIIVPSATRAAASFPPRLPREQPMETLPLAVPQRQPAQKSNSRRPRSEARRGAWDPIPLPTSNPLLGDTPDITEGSGRATSGLSSLSSMYLDRLGYQVRIGRAEQKKARARVGEVVTVTGRRRGDRMGSRRRIHVMPHNKSVVSVWPRVGHNIDANHAVSILCAANKNDNKTNTIPSLDNPFCPPPHSPLVCKCTPPGGPSPPPPAPPRP